MTVTGRDAAPLMCVLLLVLALLQGCSSLLDTMGRRSDIHGAFQREGEAHNVLQGEELISRFPSLKHARSERSAGLPTSTTYDFLDHNPTGIIHYVGNGNDVVLVLTFLRRSQQQGGFLYTSTHLYRSTDYGASFNEITSTLDPNDNSVTLYPYFYISPSNKNVLAFPHATEPKMYITQTNGADFNVVKFTPSTINPQSLTWHPTQENWILAHDGTNDHLYVSLDFGATWRKIADYVGEPTDYQWGVEGIDPISTVFFNVYDPHDPNRGDNSVKLYTSQEPFNPENQKELDPALGLHDDFVVVGPYIFAKKTDDNVVSLLVSYNRTPFHTAHIPSPLSHQRYSVNHLNYLQAMVTVQHEQNVYNLYLSDATGIYYSLSLYDIVQNDIEVIEGINGTIIANQKVRYDPSEPGSVRTVISFDNGGLWSIVPYPSLDMDGHPITCDTNTTCSLHLHMASSEYYRLGVYSEQSSPGIIMAHGNVGTELSSNPDLYISQDGGNTWHQTLRGGWGGRLLDYGGLIVVAKDYHTTEYGNTLMYSCDEGLTWTEFVFTDRNMTVYGVITEPGETTTIVSLFGMDSARTWIVSKVDFQPIFPRDCLASDYYGWKPGPLLLGRDCSLGAEVTIERRKIDTCCKNGGEYVRTVSYSICECTEEDFDCDYGYMRTDEGTGSCVLDPTVQKELTNPCANQKTTYLQTQGYRKVPGDVCVDGVSSEFEPKEMLCCKDTGQPGPDPVTTPPTTVPTLIPTSSAPLTDTGPDTVTTPPGPDTVTTPPTTVPTLIPTSSAPLTGVTCSNTVSIVLGIMFLFSLILNAILLASVVFFIIKHRLLYKRYIRLAVDPEMERFTFRNESPTSEPVNTGSNPQHEHDDDDRPIMP